MSGVPLRTAVGRPIVATSSSPPSEEVTPSGRGPVRRGVRAPPGRSPSRRIAILAVVAAAIAVTATFSVAEVEHWGPFASTPVAPAIEPILTTAVGVGTGGNPVNLSGALVSVFSILPSSVAAATPSPQGTPAQHVLLWQGTTGSNGAAKGDLGSEFLSIAHAWTAVDSPITRTVSLLVEGTYFLYNASTNRTSVYTYSNYLAYDPSSPPASFDATVVFDLAHPSNVLVGPAELISTLGLVPATRPPVYCGGPWDNWTTNYDQDFTGPFPLAMVNNTARSGPPYLEASLAENIGSSTVSFGFTGSGGESSGGSTTYSMTSGASWSSGNMTVSVNQTSAAALSLAVQAFALIYTNNVTLNVLRNTMTNTYFNFINGKCVKEVQTFYYLHVSVVGMQGSSFGLHSAAPNSAYGQLLTELAAENGGMSTAYNNSVGAGNSLLWSSMTYQASGYSNVASLESEVVGVLSTFDTFLGVALAVLDLSDACWWACSGVDVSDTLGILSTALDLGTWMISAISSVSFSTTVHESYDTITYSAVDGGFHFQVLESPSQTSLTTSNGTAYAQMPSNVVAWHP